MYIQKFLYIPFTPTKHTLRGEKAFPPHNGILISKREKAILFKNQDAL